MMVVAAILIHQILNILQGNIDDVTGGQIERIDLVPSIVSGTDVERAQEPSKADAGLEPGGQKTEQP